MMVTLGEVELFEEMPNKECYLGDKRKECSSCKLDYLVVQGGDTFDPGYRTQIVDVHTTIIAHSRNILT